MKKKLQRNKVRRTVHAARPSRAERQAVTMHKPSTVATLQMVAQEAGVSPSTVSRILNGTARVKPAKQQAVAAAISKLQFMPNPVAQSLARGRTMTVGVITQALDSPYYGAALTAIEQALLRADYSPVFASGHWREKDERRAIEQLTSRRVDGIILLTSCLKEQELLDLAAKTPVIVTGRPIAGGRILALDVDSTAGARLLTEYLIDQGHQRIGFIGGPKHHPDAVQRLAGYQQAFRSRKLHYESRWVVEGDYLEAGGYEATQELLARDLKLTAIFAANDQMAYGSMVALYRAGLKVPTDVSVAGFDDLPSSAFTVPPLTSVHRSIAEMGTQCAMAIMDLIDKRTPALKPINATLAIRESTCRV
jgi:LacI family transcriptional regulator